MMTQAQPRAAFHVPDDAALQDPQTLMSHLLDASAYARGSVDGGGFARLLEAAAQLIQQQMAECHVQRGLAISSQTLASELAMKVEQLQVHGLPAPPFILPRLLTCPCPDPVFRPPFAHAVGCARARAVSLAPRDGAHARATAVTIRRPPCCSASRCAIGCTVQSTAPVADAAARRLRRRRGSVHAERSARGSLKALLRRARVLDMDGPIGSISQRTPGCCPWITNLRRWQHAAAAGGPSRSTAREGLNGVRGGWTARRS